MDCDPEVIEKIQGLVGFGLGTKRLDNELIEDAFVLGSGMIAGYALSVLGDTWDEEQRERFAFACYEATMACLPEESAE
jgi:hypothetical protein